MNDGLTFVIITLEYLDRFWWLLACAVVNKNNFYAYMKTCPPLTYATLWKWNITFTFHTFIMHSKYNTCCIFIKHGVKHKVHQDIKYRENKLTVTRYVQNDPLWVAWTQAPKHVDQLASCLNYAWKLEYWCIEYLIFISWVRSFSTTLTSVIFAEDKVLIFLFYEKMLK